MKKIKVAVTGNIGSGKSEFCKYIENSGYPVFYADQISKKILAENPTVIKSIKDAFGQESYIDGAPNTHYLADVVFSDPERVKKINSILHPVVFEVSEELMKTALRKHNIVFYEAALIFESGREKLFNYVVLITAPEQLRFERAASGRKMNFDEFHKREMNQIAEEQKANYAHFVFINDSSIEELHKKASLLITLLKARIN